MGELAVLLWSLCSHGRKRTENTEKRYFSVFSVRFLPWLALHVAFIFRIGAKNSNLRLPQSVRPLFRRANLPGVARHKTWA
jgi:hypothetical protein